MFREHIQNTVVVHECMVKTLHNVADSGFQFFGSSVEYGLELFRNWQFNLKIGNELMQGTRNLQNRLLVALKCSFRRICL
jgi:hypothetical protein